MSVISTLVTTLTLPNSYSRLKVILPFCLCIVCRSFIRLRSPNHSYGSGWLRTALAIIMVNEWIAPKLWQGNVRLQMHKDKSCRWSRIMDLGMSTRLQQHDKWNGVEEGTKLTSSRYPIFNNRPSNQHVSYSATLEAFVTILRTLFWSSMWWY